MELTAGIKASLAGRYASALFDLASEGGTVTAAETDLENLAGALRESAELRALIRNPEIKRHQIASVMNGLSDHLGLSALTRNFLGVLANNRRVADLPAIIRAFSAIAAAQRGEVQAEVASAHALTDEQITTLETKLRAREGRTVKLTSRVDPNLLGGLVVTIGSQRIDSSIRTRLNSLAQAMKSA
ncbi:F0F1 ATP synthase subunit delta [Erythrobacter arachoides]|uniref:ATP synthase subunit delta n=1 Tax=Aurantiacibacter arachoides TaxID=1850444 RepID=A0A845A0P5_9SPHN|nr:F0F1 ATP synthase subunit delta [Aurantiacibacter arachoides]MXO93518.1 F0F1 ATP synthase subunit delta [Aurantiacibacter arachoides]GGD48725.1 ATP synthase subunit delta [Aurantiacibacter arachoides]